MVIPVLQRPTAQDLLERQLMKEGDVQMVVSDAAEADKWLVNWNYHQLQIIRRVFFIIC